MIKKIVSTIALSTLLLQGCATPHVVEVNKVTDTQLSCQQLLKEIDEAKQFEKKARDERKVTGKNVAAAVLFWPALLGTYSNTEEAIDAARERQKNLTDLYQRKSCH